MMNSTPNFRILNPVLKMHWAGWESDTLTLQRAGWQLSANQDVEMSAIYFAIKHPVLKLYGISDRIMREYLYYEQPSAYFNGKQYPDIPITIRSMASDIQVHTMVDNISNFKPVDAKPVFVDMEIKSLEDFKIFAPINIPKHKILIDPNDTQRMLARILELQSPKQAEIREKRNKEIREFMRENSNISENISPIENVFAEILV